MYGWSQFDETRNIDFHSVLWQRAQGNVLVDPLPLSEHDQAHLEQLGGAAWIVITNSDHARASQAVAELTGARIAGPALEQGEFPLQCDRWLANGDDFEGLTVLALDGSKTPGELALLVEGTTLITGDLIDMHGIGEADLAPLGEIESPALFCIGNHERYVDLEDICARLQNLGVEVLRNRTVSKNDIQFIGIDDSERKDQVARQLANFETSSDAYRVLLYHRPDGADAAATWGADLMLTGHTHRGQIFPFNLLVKRVFPQLYQSYEVEDMTLYVSPGTGTWGPVMRLGSKCEITAFNLV